MQRLHTTITAVTVAIAITVGTSPAKADKLDDVINKGILRCGVVLDFPPIGYRDRDNKPAGFDVEYCKDMAKALEVKFEILPLVWAERLPFIITNRADVVFGGTSDSLERAKTVGFSIPYAVYYAQAVVGKNSGIKTFEDMKGKRVAAAISTVQEVEFLKYARKWGTENLYQGYESENEVFLAVAQGRADAGITTSTAVKPIVAKYDTIIVGPRMAWGTDYTSIIGPRKDFGWLNYLNLFVTHQVRSGRYQELWEKFVGGKAPELRIPGVMY